jgi:hypothetical protein
MRETISICPPGLFMKSVIGSRFPEVSARICGSSRSTSSGVISPAIQMARSGFGVNSASSSVFAFEFVISDWSPIVPFGVSSKTPVKAHYRLVDM